MAVEREGGGGGGRLREQRLGLHRHARRDQLAGGCSEACEASPAPVQRDHHGVAVTEDLADPPTDGGARTMLDEHSHAVGVGAFDRRAKVDRRQRLARDRSGAALVVGGVAVVGDVRVEPHPGDIEGLALVDLPPPVGGHVGQGHVHREVVVHPEGVRRAFTAQPSKDAGTSLGVPGDDHVTIGVHDREVRVGLARDGVSHDVHRRGHRPRRPARTGREETGGFGLVDHRVEVAPGAKREERVGLAGGVTEGGGAWQREASQSELGVELTQGRRAPESIQRGGVVGLVVGPAKGRREACEPTPKALDELRHLAHETLTHLRVGRAGAGEYARQLADVIAKRWCGSEEDVRSRRGAVAHVASGSGREVGVVADQHEPRRPVVRLSVGVEGPQDVVPITPREDPQRRSSGLGGASGGDGDARRVSLHGGDGDNRRCGRLEVGAPGDLGGSRPPSDLCEHLEQACCRVDPAGDGVAGRRVFFGGTDDREGGPLIVGAH